MITKQENTPIADAEISLQQWLYDRVEMFISGRVLEIADGPGIIAPLYGDHADVKQIDLADEDFEDRYSEMIGAYDTLIILNAGEQIKTDRNIVYNSTLLLRQGGHIITRLPARTALFNGLNQGYNRWKSYNLQYISKRFENYFRILKTRFFLVSHKQPLVSQFGKYCERVTLFTVPIENISLTGLSIIVAAKKQL